MTKNLSVQKNQPKENIAPITKCWMYGRYCCFRHGVYPLLVAPILTAAFILSVYSTTGCRFVEVDVGFNPANEAWNASSASLGFYYHYRPESPSEQGESKYDPDLLDDVHQDCYWYTETLEDNFINNDRTWKVARIMALISGGGSGLAAILSWTFVGPCYCPVTVLWPVFFLPIVMMAFIAEGSKFLIFDISICRNEIFQIDNEDGSELEGVDSCSLGTNAIQAIISGSLLLVSMLLVCFNVPNEREMDPRFGMTQEGGIRSPNSEGGFPEHRTVAATKSHESEPRILSTGNPNANDIEKNGEGNNDEEAMEFTDEYYEDDDPNEFGISEEDPYMSHRKPPSPLSMRNIEDPSFAQDEILENDGQDDNPIETKSLENTTLASSKVEDVGDEIRISESRLSTLASVESSVAGSVYSPTASNMLESLVEELNVSYQQGEALGNSKSKNSTSSR